MKAVTGGGRHQLRERKRRPPRSSAFALLTVLLMVVLGFGLAVQVRSSDSGDALDSARPSDLLVVLDTVGRREAALRQEISSLEDTLASLQRDDGGSGAALAEARDRLAALSIQVGTVAASGPGVVVTISDPYGGVGSDVLLEALQELRAAGAEAVEISAGAADSVRIGVDSWIAGRPGAVIVDGREMFAPFVLTAIGDPPTLAAALDIPGGVVDSVARAGGVCDVSRSEQVNVSALRDPRSPQYSRPGN